MVANYDVVIIGSGAAGLAAGLYAARSHVRTLILERETPGGELMTLDLVENYPGYNDGVLGPYLGSNMIMQAKKFGIELQLTEVERIVPETNNRLVKLPKGISALKRSSSQVVLIPKQSEFLAKRN